MYDVVVIIVDDDIIDNNEHEEEAKEEEEKVMKVSNSIAFFSFTGLRERTYNLFILCPSSPA